METKPKAINYTPGSMSFTEGLMGTKGNVGFTMRLDLEKAKKVIKGLLKEGKNPHYAMIGLDGDWAENSDILYDDGVFKNPGIWEVSIWAEPILMVYYKDVPSEMYPVWKKEKEQTQKA